MRVRNLFLGAILGVAAGCSANPQPDVVDVPITIDVNHIDAQMDVPVADVSCATGQMRCGGACTDVQNDRNNCGSCGHACTTGQACTAGACTGGSTCGTGETSCSGACVNTMADPANCGSCAHACTSTQTCTAGACVAAITCPGGQMDCGGTCTDILTSMANCGGCGHACTAGQTCTAGSCAVATCAASEMRCSGICVNTSNDAANCGSCGHACAASELCTSGSCVAACAAPRMICTVGGAMMCIDTSSDTANCGSCGHTCGAGMSCVSGTCGCSAGQMACSGTCVNTSTDDANCGSCGHACTGGQTCSGGTCACPSGQSNCGGTCANTMTDPMHCGAGCAACTAPATCNAGVCNTLCGAGTTACGGICVIVSTDNNNCGSCGTVCGTGTSCISGTCVPHNDRRANAEAITLADSEVTVSGTTLGAAHDGPTVSCNCTYGGDVWYRFTVTAASDIVYFDTAGSGYDTSLYFTNSAGAAIPGQSSVFPGATTPPSGNCNDDAQCTTGGFTSIRESQTAAILSPGTYYVVVSGCGTGDFTLHAQHYAAVAGTTAAYWYPGRITGNGTASTHLLVGNVTSGTCGGSGSGEDARWFMTCGATPQFFSLCQSDTGASFERRLNAQYYDPTMYIRSAQTGSQVTCDDDGTDMGGTNCVGTVSGTGGTFVNDTLQRGARINNVVVPRGVNVEFVDSYSSGTAGMNYSMVYRLQ